ncbi:adenylate/guanylate cyclase domain-containing protein [Mycolicibacterium mucogenicum]|uniref:adenylate/guanylate cyclase domain-containing protein n=1 Tax=Mycolicibacterium mucogenicum TaxID=56689 RepID=UPI00226A1A87|nr:adenylate/guanylate cyclase domain-containing protein [Mycolicibacterium mucogenicum]MCX8558285.1 adenylate/guanylate cyclase domain-containing protein [Mycolicibacterium mucogenicum]
MTADHDNPETSGLFDGLDGRARHERAELVSWLLDRGFDADQIRAQFSPMFLPALRAVGDDGNLVTARHIAAHSGVSLDLIERMHRAIGLVRVDADTLQPRADAESVLWAARLIDTGMGEEQVLLILRSLMEGLTIAAANMRYAALQVSVHPGTTEIELAQALEVLANNAEPVLGPLVDELMRVALRHSFETEAITALERATGSVPGTRQVAVAFADLVGFTRLGEVLPPEELGLVAGRLGDLTREIVEGPVQFVKTIGDAVMLVSADPVKLLTTVLDLEEAVEAAAFPRLRAGVAFGPAVSRSGDWFGSPVNLASRVTGAAPAGTVWVTDAARTEIGDAADIDWSTVGPRHFKGVRAEVLVHRASRS